MRIKIISFNFVSIILSLYVALFIIEVVLIFTNLDRQLKKPNIQKIISLKIKSMNLDSRNLIEFYSDYKNTNPDVVLSTTSTGLNSHLDSSFTLDSGEKIFPLSGISNKETILNNERGHFIKYNSDNFGFNNPFQWNKKYDYLLLGDSIVEGFGVNEKNNLAGNLKRLLNKEDGAINLGRGANGPLKNYATLKEYINLLKIDKIFYFHTAANDLDDLKLELKNPILKNYLTNKNYLQNLSQLQEIIDKNLMIKTEMIIKKYYDSAELQQKNNFIKHIKLHRLVRFKNKILRNLKKPNEEKITKQLIQQTQSHTIRQAIQKIAQESFPRIKQDGTIDKKSIQQYSQYLFGWNKRRLHLTFADDAEGCGVLGLKDNIRMTWDKLWKIYKPYEDCDHPTKRSLYDSQLWTLC